MAASSAIIVPPTRKVRQTLDGGHAIFCPGCEDVHVLRPRTWSYNNDPIYPTFTPFLLFTSGHYVEGEENKPCWCTFETRFPRYKGTAHPICSRCHSFVLNGKIEFLPDCSHKLARQTVALPEWPYPPGSYGGIKED